MKPSKIIESLNRAQQAHWSFILICSQWKLIRTKVALVCNFTTAFLVW